MTAGQALDARRGVELGPFGAQHGDGVALAAQFIVQLADARALQGRIELDLVDSRGGQNERANDEHVEKAHAQRPLMMSARDGNTGKRSERSPACTGAAVRSPARSLAERARGLVAISSASAVTTRLVRTRKVGAACFTSGAWREPPPAPARDARNALTM